MIQFLSVTSNETKMEAICQTAIACFHQGQRLQFLVSNRQAAVYLDQLLWRLPPESFLPHAIAETVCDEPIVITEKKENLNQATVLFNLCPEVPENGKEYAEIYELMDRSNLNKLALAQAKLQVYKQVGYEVSSATAGANS